MEWTRPDEFAGFYSRELPERSSSEENSLGGFVAGKRLLPEVRQAVVDETHRLISSRWVNGGLVGGCYRIEPFDPAGELPVPQAAAIPSALDGLANCGLLPAELAGCSTVLLEDGGVWEEAPQQFANAVYAAIQAGGAYSEQLPEANAEARTRQYMRALAGERADDLVHFFGLDPAFSCWFQGVAWDFGYVVVHRSEKWLALICATDTD